MHTNGMRTLPFVCKRNVVLFVLIFFGFSQIDEEKNEFEQKNQCRCRSTRFVRSK